MATSKSNSSNPAKQDQKNDPLRLVRRMSQGLVGWLAYIDVGWRGKALSEHYLYAPIFEMALGRRWRIHPQCPIKKETGRRGAPKTIDFAMSRIGRKELPTALLALEVKFPTKDNPFPKTYVYDCTKLGSLTPDRISFPKDSRFECALMIAGKSGHIEHLTTVPANCDQHRKKLIKQLKKVLSPTSNQGDTGWCYDSGRYRVAVMVRQSWWNEKSQGGCGHRPATRPCT